MRLYDCTVRLNGSLLHSVRKYGVTAAEIVVLRYIHGQSENSNDPVADIVAQGETRRADAQERARLSTIYRNGEEPGPVLINRLLGVAGVPLPLYVAGFDDPAEVVSASDLVVDDEPLAEAPVRTRVTKPKLGAAETVAA
jgi:hypothetical protein